MHTTAVNSDLSFPAACCRSHVDSVNDGGPSAEASIAHLAYNVALSSGTAFVIAVTCDCLYMLYIHVQLICCRGHVDSVNEVCWQPFSSSLCTASSDKTVSVWDARSGLCTQTFYGHHNSVNCVAYNCQVGAIAPVIARWCTCDGCMSRYTWLDWPAIGWTDTF